MKKREGQRSHSHARRRANTTTSTTTTDATNAHRPRFPTRRHAYLPPRPPTHGSPPRPLP